MVSLSILGFLTVVQLLVQALAMGVVARKLGSSRGTFRRAALASGLTLVVGIAGLFALLMLQPGPQDMSRPDAFNPDVLQRQHAQAAVTQLMLGVLQLILCFVVLLMVYRLTVARTFGVWGVLLATQIFGLILAIAVVRPFLVEAFIIPTGSMSPTIDPGNRIIANKLQSPHRFDLLAYRANTPGNPAYVKRVIALPGERLRFDNGDIYINDLKVDAPPILAGKCHAMVGSMSDASNLYRDGQTITLAAGDYFVLGDNIDVSIDSRWQGPTHKAAIIGVVDAIYWPMSRMRIVR